MSNVDHTLGRAYVGVNRAVSQVKAQFVDEKGAPRLERVVPAGLLVVGSWGCWPWGSAGGDAEMRSDGPPPACVRRRGR